MEKSNSSTVLCMLIIVDFISHLCAFRCQSEICQKYVSSMDQLVNNRVSPCDNFYDYSCSHYNNANNFKGDPMKMTESHLNSQLSDILKNMKVSESKAVQSVKQFYSTCTDTGFRGRNGNGILLDKLTDYGGWPILQNSMDPAQFDDPHFEILIGKLRSLGYSLLIKLNVKVDERKPNRHITVLNVPHVEPLPDFNGNIMTYIGIIAAQSTVIRNMAKLLGPQSLNDSIVKQDIKDMFTFQMKLQQIANRSRDDVHTSYNVMKITNLHNRFSQRFNWIEYLNAVFDGTKKFGPQDELLISDVDYLVKLMDLIDSVKPRTVRNYILWQVVKDVAEDGDSTMRNTITPYRGNANMINDTCLKEAKGFMGFAVLAMYLDGNDHRQHLTLVNSIVSYLKKAFSSLIEFNSWMDPVTKEKAQMKLKSMGVKIGYQPWILNNALLDTFYSQMPQLRNNHLENIFILSQFHSRLELDFVNKAVDKLNWQISPLISNAFYHRSLNEIYIPVAILQEPLFHLEWPMSANFGAIGSVIGHEMGHGFDSKSLVMASNNSLINWWPSSVTKMYEAAASCVKRQYEKYCLPPHTTAWTDSDVICVNGENTLIENIADIGGVKASFEGFLLWKLDNIASSSPFKSEILFFLAYSQLWCSQLNPTIALDQIASSINSPNKYRLIGPLENLNNFKTVFNCTKTAVNSQCRIW